MDSLLNDLLKNGILDETVICKIKAMKDQEYLNMHRYKIYQNKDGRWVTYLPGRRRIQRKDRAELEALVIEYYKKNRYDPTIIDIFKEWNERRVNLNKIKPSTATRFDHDFDKFFSEFGRKRLSEVLPNDISTFLEDQVGKYHLSRKAFANLKTLTRGIFKRAKKLGCFPYSIDMIFSDMDVSDADFKPKIIDDSKEIFYDDELELVTAYCQPLNWLCYVAGPSISLLPKPVKTTKFSLPLVILQAEVLEFVVSVLKGLLLLSVQALLLLP